MNEIKATAPETQPQVRAGSTRIIDVLIVLAQQKKLIIGLPLVTAIAAVAISLSMHDLYKSGTKLLPPQQSQSGAAAILSQLGGTIGAVAGAAGIKNPGDLYVGMLRSRTLADKLVAKFDLKKVYNVPLFDQARQQLAERTVISSGKDGLIEITVIDEDRKRAAQLANAYVTELQKLTQELALTEASQRRAFFERQLESTKNNLASAEMTLKSALDVTGVISVDSDSRAIVETVSRLRAQIAAKEIELSAMQSFVTPNNSDFKRVQEQIRSLRAEYDQLQNGSNNPKGDQASNKNGQAGLQNIKILRDVKYQQMLYEMLAKQYELARLDEAKDSGAIQVLDPAIEAERKFKPARSIIVGLSTVLAFFAAVAIALLRHARDNMMRDSEYAAKWKSLKSSLRFR